VIRVWSEVAPQTAAAAGAFLLTPPLVPGGHLIQLIPCTGTSYMMPGLDKGKGPATAAVVLPCPSAGSTNPSNSLASLWNYLLPALDHIMRTPQETGQAGVISSEYHVLIHTAVYNYFLAQNQDPPPPRPLHDRLAAPPSGLDLYERLDAYFGTVARDILHAAPVEDALATYLVDRYECFSASVQCANRLLNYMNRHFVKRSVDEDRGWLQVADVIDGAVNDLHNLETREKLIQRVRDHRRTELEKWGYSEGCTPELAAAAEASAEAASPPGRVIPIASVAYRRFRVDIVEPLLAVPKSKGGSKRRPPPSTSSGPKGRLARSVKALLEDKGGDPDEKRRIAGTLADCFARIGVRQTHPLRQRLQSFLAKS
jgi:hypothetical protein